MNNSKRKKTTYAFIVDTDSYAGNFERELCAWMTGTTDEHGNLDICKKFKQMFYPNLVKYSETPWDELVFSRPNNDGDCPDNSPYALFGPKAESLMIYLSKKPTPEEIAFLKERAYEVFEKYKDEFLRFCPPKINILGFRLQTETTEYEEEEC